jgi:serine kinase of HPr protein (carbohydrate metabolism regulator)
MKDDATARIHATLVAVPRPGSTLPGGALLLGPPGAGKSDVGLRLIESGSILVADDQVDLSLGDGGLWGAAPSATAGLIEARGIGLIRLPYEGRARIAVVVELVTGDIERMPARRWYQPPQNFRARGGALRIPLFALNAFQASTPAKIRALVQGKLEG